MKIASPSFLFKLVFISILTFAFSTLHAQEYASIEDSRPIKYARYHSKLQALYTGYVIEIARSEYPMLKSEPIFKKYGNVVYDKLPEGGYSYVILTEFSSWKPALKFCNQMVVPNIQEAQVIKYKKGRRKFKK